MILSIFMNCSSTKINVIHCVLIMCCDIIITVFDITYSHESICTLFFSSPELAREYKIPTC